MMLVQRIWYWINYPMVDILLYSHHLPAWYCINIVRRNSVLVTCGSERVNTTQIHGKIHCSPTFKQRSRWKWSQATSILKSCIKIINHISLKKLGNSLVKTSAITLTFQPLLQWVHTLQKRHQHIHNLELKDFKRKSNLKTYSVQWVKKYILL